MNKMASMGYAGTALRVMRGVNAEEKNNEKAQVYKIKNQAYRRHFPKKGLIASFLKEASLRGAAAKRLLGS